MKSQKTLSIEIDGGLGNQLFMLSAGIFLSEKYKRKICFDISNLARIARLHPGHNILTLGLLGEFQVKDTSESFGKNRIRHLYLKFRNYLSTRILSRLPRSTTLQVSEIGFYDFDLLPPYSRKIVGYFQTWKYYSEIEGKLNLGRLIHREHSEWYRTQKKVLEQGTVAAFHMRRGDYSLSINRSNGILSLEYFESIMNLIPYNVDFWIFTDEPTSVRGELFKLRSNHRKIYVLEPPVDSDPIESMLLMSHASYIAISNSTFSWWSAALANNETQIFAPSKWFEGRRDPLELIPENWIKIESKWVSQ